LLNTPFIKKYIVIFIQFSISLIFSLILKIKKTRNPEGKFLLEIILICYIFNCQKVFIIHFKVGSVNDSVYGEKFVFVNFLDCLLLKFSIGACANYWGEGMYNLLKMANFRRNIDPNLLVVKIFTLRFYVLCKCNNI